MASAPDTDTGPHYGVDVVCFGMLNRCYILVVDEIPDRNAGAQITQVAEIMGDDAAIVAQLLQQWGIPTGLVCNAVGDDEAGRAVARRIHDLGIAADIRASSEVSTPLEMSASDPKGGRTYFWERRPDVLATLGTADLSLFDGARLLYADWYDGAYTLRPMEQAVAKGIPVFFNLESRFDDDELVDRMARYATVCQVSLDEPRSAESTAEAVADRLLDAGVSTALLTMGDRGCLVADRTQVIRVGAPPVEVVDGYGAGAMFSAAFIRRYLGGDPLGDCARFATAAASLKCEVVGPVASPISEIERLASTLTTVYV